MTNKKTWFKEWFDSPYYHLLYSNRDYNEAKFFIKNLIKFLKIENNSSVLDLACGKGRHSIYMNKLGFNVTGYDLSEKNIIHAKKYENDKLNFCIHDMRFPFKGHFDVIFNLFTSFGYFENIDDDSGVLINIKNSLKNDGLGVIDFMNSNYVKNNLIDQESFSKANIQFLIKRKFVEGFVLKNIKIFDGKDEISYNEKVRLYSLDDFKCLLNKNGLILKSCYGDYQMNNFDVNNSPRMIIIFKPI